MTPAILSFSDGSALTASRWLEVLPFPPATQRVVLRYDGRELDRRQRSANTPAVQILYPNGGERLDGAFEVRWGALDADGDDLVYTLQYSVNGGGRRGSPQRLI